MIQVPFSFGILLEQCHYKIIHLKSTTDVHVFCRQCFISCALGSKKQIIGNPKSQLGYRKFMIGETLTDNLQDANQQLQSCIYGPHDPHLNCTWMLKGLPIPTADVAPLFLLSLLAFLLLSIPTLSSILVCGIRTL